MTIERLFPEEFGVVEEPSWPQSPWRRTNDRLAHVKPHIFYYRRWWRITPPLHAKKNDYNFKARTIPNLSKWWRCYV